MGNEWERFVKDIDKNNPEAHITRQLFFDDQRLLLRNGFVREYGQPQLIPESIYRDECEVGCATPAIWRAPDGKYHMFYFGTPVSENPSELENLEPGGIVLAAISDDGIHFKTRNTAVEAGVKNPHFPNQVLDYFEGELCSIYIDEYAPADERLKILCDEHDNENCHLMCRYYTSGDGIHWKKNPNIWNGFGAECGVAYPNHIYGTTCIATRPDGGDRRVAICETSDWKKFSENELCMNCDSCDPVLTEVYGMAPFSYAGMFISFLWKYNTDTSQHATKFQGGTITNELSYSYNGHHWQRALRENFLDGKTGGSEKVFGYENKMIFGFGVRRDENNDIIILAYGSSGEHGVGFRTKGASAVMQYTLREDDFIHLRTADSKTPALICTRDNCWRGGELSINLSCEAATVALYNRENKLITGFGHEDCIPFSGDSKCWQPEWNNSHCMSELTGRIVQIEIRMKNGALYSLSGNYSPLMDLQSHRWQYLNRDSTRPGF